MKAFVVSLAGVLFAAAGVAQAAPEAAPPSAKDPEPAAAPAVADTPKPQDPNLEKYVEALTNDSYKVRLQAAVLLGRSQDERAIKPLIDALNADEHYTVRAVCATALANLNAVRAVSHIVKRIAVDNEDFVRNEAQRALAKYSRDDALPYVVAAYGSPDPRVRRQALIYLAAEVTPVAEPVLARGLGDTPEIAAIAKDAVRKLGGQEQVRFLELALEHREPSVRRGAIDVLVSMGTPEATQLVLKVYERDIEEREVRDAARQALRDLKAHLPMGTIVRDATAASEKHLRARSLRLLGVVGGNDAERVLTAAIHDEDPYVQGIAVMAMGELGNPSMVAALEKLLEDEPRNQSIVNLVRNSLRRLKAKKE